MAETVNKTLTYKRSKLSGSKSSDTFQTFLLDVTKSKPVAFDRRQVLDPEGKSYRILNTIRNYKGMFFGEIFDYTEGQAASTATISKTNKTMSVKAMTPEGDDREFIESIMYFGVLDDHVILVQSSALKSRQCESYLNWLLHEAGKIPDESYFAIVDHVPPKESEKVANSKGLSVNAPVRFEAIDADGESHVMTKPEIPETDQSDTKKLSFRPFGVGWETLKALFPNGMLPESLSADDVIVGRELEVKVELKWSRAQKQDSTKLLDTVANHMRHVESEDLNWEIKTASGATITADSIRLTRPVRTPAKDGLVRYADLWAKMHDWLEELIDTEAV